MATRNSSPGTVTRRIGRMTLTVPSDREVVLTRVFDAPRRQVWEAYTKPEHVARWYGPRGTTMSVCEIDLRPGGVWRYVHSAPGGGEVAFRGEFREVAPPERLVYTFEFEGMPGAVCLETVTFAEDNGRTTVTTTDTFDSVEARDGMLASGMEGGAAESYDRMEELLEAIARGATMAADDSIPNGAHAQEQRPEPSPALRALNRLVGTWEHSGGVQGTVTYEWMEGGFFLIQRVELEQDGQKVRGIEIIGHERPFGAEPGEDIRSRFYDSTGNTLDYTYELEEDTLTIWGGEKGSPAYARGEFNDDGNTCTGAWHYPGGGGYEWTMTRIE
jgi:uncharacterized protein YndB with AHSA1/START domain